MRTLTEISKANSLAEVAKAHFYARALNNPKAANVAPRRMSRRAKERRNDFLAA